MAVMILFVKIILSALLTCAGSVWIDRLYRSSKELTFPNEISWRSRYRKPILFCTLAILFNFTDDLWIMAAIYLLMLMTLTDFEQYMLFDAMTLPLALIGATRAWHFDFQMCILASIIGGGIFFLLAVVSKGAVGGGDVKLIAALGLWLGSDLLSVTLYGTIAGGLVALLLIATKQKDRKSYFAYGPYFALSAVYFLLVKYS